jgi:hypothetical protein
MIYKLMARIFFKIGTMLFPVLLSYAPTENDGIRVLMFGASQSDINSACRSYIDWLDEEYEKRQTNTTNKT